MQQVRKCLSSRSFAVTSDSTPDLGRYIDGLPKSSGKNVIFVVVDRLSKYAHFIAMSHPYTTSSVAQAFFDNVFKFHGMPKTIVSDRDRVFLGDFWQQLFKLRDKSPF